MSLRPKIESELFYPERVSLAMLTSINRSQIFDSDGEGAWDVTLCNPRVIENLSEEGGYLAVQITGDSEGSIRRLYFNPGQAKPYRVKKVFGSSEGSTIKCLIGE